MHYIRSTKPNSLRIVHTIFIDGEKLESTKQDEILHFARPKIDNYEFKELKTAIRIGEDLHISK